MISLVRRWSRIPKRVDEAELLDLDHGTVEDARETLSDIARLNLWLGGNAVLDRFLYPRIRLAARQGAVRILDVGSGSALLPLKVAKWSLGKGYDVRIVALDNSERNLRIARDELSRETRHVAERISLVRADAQQTSFRASSFDFVISTLLLHHFDRRALVTTLRSMASICSGTLVLHDLIRDRVPLLLFNVVSRLVARNEMARADGFTSIRRAYTPAEMRRMLREAGLEHAGIHVHRLFYRMTIVAESKALS